MARAACGELRWTGAGVHMSILAKRSRPSASREGQHSVMGRLRHWGNVAWTERDLKMEKKSGSKGAGRGGSAIV